MRKGVAALVLVLALALWVSSSMRTQSSVSGFASTAQAQLTSVAGPTPTVTSGP